MDGEEFLGRADGTGKETEEVDAKGQWADRRSGSILRDHTILFRGRFAEE